jgi:hypothetical protein
MESFEIAGGNAYRRLPTPDGQGIYRLSPAYVDQVARDVRQLSQAGVRLAFDLTDYSAIEAEPSLRDTAASISGCGPHKKS